MTEERKLKLVTVRLRLAEQRITLLEARKQVTGTDIYVQDTQPTATGDYVWIDTSGVKYID